MQTRDAYIVNSAGRNLHAAQCHGDFFSDGEVAGAGPDDGDWLCGLRFTICVWGIERLNQDGTGAGSLIVA